MRATESVLDVVKSVPIGRVTTYGDVGRAASPMVSGLVVGRILGNVLESDQIPWWRVVGSGGHLLTARRDPRLALRQRERLEAEGVVFDPEGRVAPGAWWFSP